MKLRVAALSLLLAGLAPAQKKSGSGAVFLDSSKPGVSVVFERAVAPQPRADGPAEGEYVLRVHNNMRWEIIFTTYGGDAHPIYDIIEDPHGYGPAVLPVRHSGCIVGSRWVRSGRTARFRIPARDLAEGLGIRIAFRYEWDSDRPADPEHALTFYHSMLPAAMRKGERRKPLPLEMQIQGGPAPEPVAMPLPSVLCPRLEVPRPPVK